MIDMCSVTIKRQFISGSEHGILFMPCADKEATAV